MPSNFPSSPDDIQNDVANGTLEVDLHPGLHNQLADAVMAIETELLAGGTMSLATHIAAADPHSVYLTQTEGDARYTTIAGGIPDGSITSAKIADGTIATADLADASVTNVKLGTDTARANLLTNGGFEIWQRGNGPFISGTTADMWSMYYDGGDTLSVSKDGGADKHSLYSLKATYTRSTGVNASIYQIIKSTECSLRQATITLSVRVLCTTGNAVRASITTDGAGGTTVLSPFNVVSGGFQTLSVTATVPIDATYVQVKVQCLASCTAYLDNAMLVVGSVPADYAPLHPADDLARCLRYYESSGATSTQTLLSGFAVWGTTGATGQWSYKAVKAVTPTITVSSPSAFTVQVGGSQFACTSLSATAFIDRTTVVAQVASGLTTNSAALLNAASGSTPGIFAEANP